MTELRFIAACLSVLADPVMADGAFPTAGRVPVQEPVVRGNRQSLSAEGIAAECEVAAGIFTWSFRSTSDASILRVELPQHHCYDQKAPAGWLCAYEHSRFSGQAPPAERGTRAPGAPLARFSARVTSSGARLGQGWAQVWTTSSPDPVTVGPIWVPVPSSSAVALPATCSIAALSLLHVWRLRARQRASLGAAS